MNIIELWIIQNFLFIKGVNIMSYYLYEQLVLEFQQKLQRQLSREELQLLKWVHLQNQLYYRPKVYRIPS